VDIAIPLPMIRACNTCPIAPPFQSAIFPICGAEGPHRVLRTRRDKRYGHATLHCMSSTSPNSRTLRPAGSLPCETGPFLSSNPRFIPPKYPKRPPSQVACHLMSLEYTGEEKRHAGFSRAGFLFQESPHPRCLPFCVLVSMWFGVSVRRVSQRDDQDALAVLRL
jgi:hypothetical protein